MIENVIAVIKLSGDTTKLKTKLVYVMYALIVALYLFFMTDGSPDGGARSQQAGPGSRAPR